jgi:molybdopterin biosynthesis enzyme
VPVAGSEENGSEEPGRIRRKNEECLATSVAHAAIEFERAKHAIDHQKWSEAIEATTEVCQLVVIPVAS